ncbi:agmatinase family protein [Jeotgalibacillus proteolyticus]|uniref:Formimidoylglutamase n=1 Tax=Jeotgalibacillus proteolyticus TaxID=2082395 RepID=A0A2S5GAA7_9BACL|nr:agmatinase family protein [Jeotgalibacillus proteolyticus]PPA69855.1 formimidoylglutamase [Jeotgalibacillus proteolyticus]
MNSHRSDLLKAFIQQPEWSWTKEAQHEGRVHHWIENVNEWDGKKADAVLLGMPLSRSSISVSGASEYPDAFRKSWRGFSTFNLDEGVDLSSLSVLDLGNVMMHGTDILESHRRIQAATVEAAKRFNDSVTIGIGGDHSVTACAVRGLKEVYPDETIGILQLDTHLDLRDTSPNGPSNGTPIRQLIDGGAVKGEHVFNIGLHGYFNAPALISYAKEHRVNMITLKQARQKGITETVQAALAQLKQTTDRLYVTVDMDVLDIGFAPGVPASTPGGMTTQELFDALLVIGKDESLKHIDFVCLDPVKDTVGLPTVKAGVYSFLQVLTGMALAKRERGE